MADPIEIIVKTGNNREYRIEVSPSETFLQVKEKIKDVTNIDVDEQVLKFNGIEVIDEYTIEFYEIENGNMIELVTINQPISNNIRISQPPGYTDQFIEVNAMKEATVAELKVKIQGFTNLPAGRMKLFFRDRELNDDLKLSGEFVSGDEPIEMRLSDNVNDDNGDRNRSIDGQSEESDGRSPP